MTQDFRILVYGDSNSWGYLDDGEGQRSANRWPVEMARRLSQGRSVTLIEECLPARTTNLPDPELGASFNGESTLEAILLSHQPLDHVLIMLGTNDLKARFNRSASDIAEAIVSLAELTRSTPAGQGGWFAEQTPDVSVICPLVIGARASDASWEKAEEWIGATDKSNALARVLQQACNAAGVHMIDGNQFGASSERDPIHWSQETHLGFGEKMAATLAARFESTSNT